MAERQAKPGDRDVDSAGVYVGMSVEDFEARAPAKPDRELKPAGSTETPSDGAAKAQAREPSGKRQRP